MPVVIFKSPGNNSLVRLLPRRQVAYCNCFLSFPVEIAGVLFIFQALGRSNRISEKGRRAEKGKGGQGPAGQDTKTDTQ